MWHRTLTRGIATVLILVLPRFVTAQVHAAPRSDRPNGVVVGTLATLAPLALGVTMLATESEGAMGLGIASVGVVLGPAVGDAVAGLGGRAVNGAVLRAVVGGAGVATSAVMVSSGEGSIGSAMAFAGVGLTFALGHAIWDLATVRSASERQLRARGSPTVAVTPTWDGHAPGVSVRVGF